MLEDEIAVFFHSKKTESEPTVHCVNQTGHSLALLFSAS